MDRRGKTADLLRLWQRRCRICCRHTRHDQLGLRAVRRARADLRRRNRLQQCLPFGAREGGGRDELRSGPSGLPRFRSPRWRGHHERRPARRTPHVGPVDLARSSGLGSSHQTLESGCWTALFGHHRKIVGRGPSHRPRPAMPHPGPRTRRPDDPVRRKRRGRRRPCGRFRPPQACWLNRSTARVVNNRSVSTAGRARGRPAPRLPVPTAGSIRPSGDSRRGKPGCCRR